MAIPKRLQTYLTKHRVAFTAIPHKTVYTAYDVAQTLHIPLREVIKTLVVRADRDLILAILPADKRLDLAKVKKALGAAKISLVSEGAMEKALKVKAGAVTPFGGYHGLRLLADRSLRAKKQLFMGTGSFTDAARVTMSRYLAVEKPVLASITEAKAKKGSRRKRR